MSPPADDAAPPERPLPARVRAALVRRAAEALGALPVDEQPPELRRVARFAPAKRATVAATPLAAALERPAFRSAVASHLRQRAPSVGEAVEGGGGAALGAVELAAALWLLRPPSWEQRLSAALDALADEERRHQEDVASERTPRPGAGTDPGGAAAATIRRLEDRLAKAERERDTAVRELRRAKESARRGQERAEAAAAELAAEQAAGRRRQADTEAEVRRLRARLTEAEATLATERGDARRGRALDAARAALLLDALQSAAAGLRRELALPAVVDRPADLVAGEDAGEPAGGRPADDPATLERMLGLPAVHLIVDGYNVTKSGYGALTLEQQRIRLVGSLGALQARRGVEVTVVFDGTGSAAGRGVGPARGVRIRFSAGGETADALIARLVAAEPPGRAVVVVSSDREVADGARAADAHPVPSAALLRLLG